MKFLDKIGKYNKIDQNYTDSINWDDLPQPDQEPTNDIIVLNPKLFDPNIEAKRTALRAKFKSGVPIETPYTDVSSEK